MEQEELGYYGRKIVQLIDDFYPLIERSYNGKYNVVDDILDLSTAIQKADLTDRQAQVIRLMADGYTQEESAEIIGISQQMVGKHINAAVRKIAKVYEQWARANKDTKGETE